MTEVKPEFTPGYIEDEAQSQETARPPLSNMKRIRTVESVRLALIVLSFLIGITILSTAADTLVVYNQTHFSADYLLPLWPENFNLRPTISLIVGSVLLVVVNGVALIGSKVSALRHNALTHLSISCAAPAISVIVSVISTAFFYIVNDSTVVDSLQSWSCRWSPLGMNSKPNWGVLCSESQAALYLTIIMIPIAVATLGISIWGIGLEKKVNQFVVQEERKGSPTLSS